MSHLTSENNFPAYIPDHEIGFSGFCFDLELKRCFEKTYFSLEMSHLTSENNFPAYIPDHEIGFSDFCFDLELKKCFKKT